MKRIAVLIVTILLSNILYADEPAESELDAQVQTFLQNHQHEWRDMNVPYADGQVLYDLIVKNGYTRALEIGTSTGHSSIWIAWALSKTGGKLLTLEIDKERREQALENFKKAGVDHLIDSRLGDAHEIVKELEGPFDFVFSDADKDWYKQYFIDLYPKLEPSGCFTAHNVTNAFGGIGEFLDYVREHPNMETTIDKSSRSGVSISYKKK